MLYMVDLFEFILQWITFNRILKYRQKIGRTHTNKKYDNFDIP